MQRVIDLCMADVLLDGERYRFVSVPRFLALRHHVAMDRPGIVLLHGHTWESLETLLNTRFPPHIWEPRHWPIVEAAPMPQPRELPPLAAPLKRKPRQRRQADTPHDPVRYREQRTLF